MRDGIGKTQGRQIKALDQNNLSLATVGSQPFFMLNYTVKSDFKIKNPNIFGKKIYHLFEFSLADAEWSIYIKFLNKSQEIELFCFELKVVIMQSINSLRQKFAQKQKKKIEGK